VPALPTTEGDGDMWKGEVPLQSWAEFMGGADSYTLFVHAEANAPPSPEQGRCLAPPARQRGVPSPKLSRRRCSNTTLRRGTGTTTPMMGKIPDEELPEVTEVAGLRPLVGVSFVHVLSVSATERAYIGFEPRVQVGHRARCRSPDAPRAGGGHRPGQRILRGRGRQEDAERAEPGAAPDAAARSASGVHAHRAAAAGELGRL